MRLSFQFHATRDELASMTWAWAKEAGVPLVWESAGESGFRLELVSPDRQSQDVGVHVSRIWLPARTPNLDVTNSGQFMAANADAFSVLLGQETDDFLRESLLGGATSDPAVMKSWRARRRSAVRGTSRGAWVVGATGVRARKDDHRFTPGAKALASAGKRMLALAGGVEFLFD
jgi:hypothetical protein